MKQVIFSLAIAVALTVLLELGSSQNLCASEGFPGATVVDRNCTDPAPTCNTICQAAGGTCETSLRLRDQNGSTVILTPRCERSRCNGRELCCCSILSNIDDDNKDDTMSDSGSDSR